MGVVVDGCVCFHNIYSYIPTVILYRIPCLKEAYRTGQSTSFNTLYKHGPTFHSALHRLCNVTLEATSAHFNF